MKLSVIIPCFNEKDRIVDCLEVLWKQTIKPEIMIVDGGSTDGTLDIIKAYQKKLKIKLFKETGVNRSPGNARNIGVKKTTGQIIYLMDVDSKIEPDFIKRIVKEFQRHPKALMIRFNCIPYFPKHFRNPLEEAIFYKDERGDSKLIIFTKKLFEKIGYLDPSLGFGEDKEWMKKAMQQPITDVKTHLVQSKSGYLDFEGMAQRYTWYGRTIPLYMSKVGFSDYAVLFGSALAILMFFIAVFAGAILMLFFSASVVALLSSIGVYSQSLGLKLLNTANWVFSTFWPILLFLSLPIVRGLLIGLRVFQKFGKLRPLIVLPFVELVAFVFMGQGIFQFLIGNKKTQRALK